MSLSYGATKRISASSTRFYKRVFPLVWFGVAVLFAALGVVIALTKGFPHHEGPVFVILPSLFALIGYLVMRTLIADLIDEVYDGGDYLVLKNRGEEEQVALTNVMNVSASTITNPPRVTLRMVNPSRFGLEVTFIPVRAFSLNLRARNRIVDDLIVRVDRARTRRVI